jgi:short-subunit dehydrogenase
MEHLLMTKRILITGASSGFGKAIAEHLSKQGHSVFGTSRNTAHLVTSDFVHMLSMDVNVPSSIDSAIASVLETSGGIDVLINNAGFGICGALEDCSIDEARSQMETNFFGQIAVIQKVLPHMRNQGHGRIINIGSLAGDIGLPYQSLYSASKAAMQRVTEALRLELKDTGVDITLIAPGDFKTGFTASRVFAANALNSERTSKMRSVVQQYERDEQNGSDPVLVAQLVDKLIAKEALKVLYTVGRADQRLAHKLKHWLPSTWFERVLAAIYKV